MNLTRMAVTRVRVTLTVILGIILGGLAAYGALPKAEDPGFTIRIVSIATPFPGASPRRVEQLVSAPIEEALQQLPELDAIRSTSRAGVSVVVAEIRDDIRDLAPVHNDIRDAVEEVQGDLPADALESEVNTDVATVFGIVYALTGEGYTHREVVDAAQRAKDALLLLDDAAEVKIFGEQERRIALRYDHGRLSRMGLSPTQLVGLLQATNISTPGGQLEVGDLVLGVEPSGTFETVEDVRAMPVTLRSGALVRLDDLVEVTDELEEPPAPRAVYGGEPAVLVGVSQRAGGDSARFGVDARTTMAALQAHLPLGLELHELNFQPDDVDVKIDSFVVSLLQSVVIVFVVMMAFLGLRTGAVVASLIPMVIFATFVTMQALGIGIDQMSLAALLIALGMLVDNAIVIAENTMVRMGAGDDAVEATVGAASELRIPLLVSSLTTCAAFLPVYLAPGGASEFVGPIFKVVTIALLASWVLATTALPLLCVLFLKVDAAPDDDDAYDTPWYATYRRWIRAAISARWLTLGGSVAALAVALWGFGFVSVAFFPPSEKPAFTAEIELPSGTSADAAAEALRRVGAFVDAELSDGVTAWGAMQGDTLPRFSLSYNGPDKATGNLAFLLHATDRGAVSGLADRLITFVEGHIPGASARAAPLVLGPGGASPVAAKLSSTDETALLEAVEQARTWLRSQPGARNIQDDWGPRTRKVVVEVDPARARLAGVTHQDIATSLLTALDGLEATELRDGEDAVPIELLASGTDDLDLLALRNLTVFGQQGSVTLQQVGEVDVVWDFGIIKREGRRRTIELSADVAPGIEASDVQGAYLRWLDDQDWPRVRVEASGELADSADANARLMSTVPMVALIITLLLMVQFDSVRKTFINLAVLPFSLVGVTIGLLVFDSYFGFITLLAIISLFGIVLNNGNVLLDRIAIELDEGRAPLDAVVEASVKRLRPILLTTATTVTGLVPLYLGGGPMFEPLAVTLMVGLVFGTILTLGLVPVLYCLLHGVAGPAPSEGAGE